MIDEPVKMAEAQPLTIEYALTRPEILRSFVRSAVESPKFLATILAYAAGIAILGLLLHVTSSHSITLTDVIRGFAWGLGFLCFIPLWVFFFIPHRAFPNADHRNSFLASIRSWMRESV